jgi:cytochrome c oxidase assembly factor CtaG
MITGTQALLQSWSPPVAVNASLCLAVVVYATGWIRLHATFPKLISAWRLAAFLTGAAGIWLAIGSPLEAFDDVSLTVHMVQHLLLMSFSPPLILLGWPALPLTHGLPQWARRGIIGPVSRSAFIKWLAGAVTQPVVCWLAAAFALVAWHLPGVFDAALRLDWLHELEHASFLAAGLLFWWPVVQPWPSTGRWPRWSIPLYLFCATLPCDVLSAFLAFCDRVVYVSYAAGPPTLGISPLQDQQRAAALMWVTVTLILLIPAIVVTMEILSPMKAHQVEERLTGSREIRDEYLHISKLEAL